MSMKSWRVVVVVYVFILSGCIETRKQYEIICSSGFEKRFVSHVFIEDGWVIWLSTNRRGQYKLFEGETCEKRLK